MTCSTSAPIAGTPAGAGSPPERTLAAARRALLALSVVSLLPGVFNRVSGDSHIYRAAVEALLSGQIPYLDRPLEYPPYALPLFALPHLLSHDLPGYIRWFAAEMLLVDTALKALLLAEGKRLLRGWWTLLPCALLVLDSWLQINLYLKRYDLVPAALTVAAVVALARGRSGLAGAALAVGAGVKLYPMVLWLPALAATPRRGRWRFLAGTAAALAPLALAAAWAPWWRFATFHAGRGLQAESLAASAVWWLHRAFGLSAEWRVLATWKEVGGPMVEALLLPARALFAAAVVLSVAVATRGAWRSAPPSSLRLARRLLLPLLAVIAFSNILSPQYLIWIFPLLGLAALEGDRAATGLLVAAAVITPFFWPSREYNGSGLGLLRASLLLARNCCLVAGWWLLLREQAAPRPAGQPAASTPA